MLLAVVASLVLGVYSRETISDNSNTPPILAKVWNLLGLRILVAGILSRDTKDHKTETDIVIMAIWAPFLLVHLGGPDTITAYSLEDNELWPRRMLDAIYQLIVVFLVVYWSWNTNPLKYVAIPVVIAGMIKYVERILSLRSGSINGFRESILTPPDPGPNYGKFMDDYIAKKNEGYHVTFEVNETTSTVLVHNSQEETRIPNSDIPDCEALRDGFKFKTIPECLFADLIFSFQDHTSSQFFFQKAKWTDAFKAVEVELGCFSRKPSGQMLLYKFVSFCQFYFKLSHTNRWSNQMSQFNLIRFCLKRQSVKCIKNQTFLRIYNFLDKYYFPKITKQVSEELKKLIFDQLKDKSKEAKDIEACKKLCAHKGDWVLNRWKCHKCYEQNCHIHGELNCHIRDEQNSHFNDQNCHIHDELNSHFNGEQNCHIRVINQSIKEVEFDQSILLWHIATDLCYCADYEEPRPTAIRSREESKLLSDYMLYLLVTCPFLLPNGIGEIRFEDTCAEVDELLKERKYIKETSQVCKIILRVNTDILPSKVKGDRSKSVLFDACKLAQSLESLGKGEHGSKLQKWEIISNVWVEILCRAASQCRGLNHAKQLSQGGELLTHVWLLMAHLGITEQFQISKGHVRAKLVIE